MPPSALDLKDFIAGFLVEADEHLHSANKNLLAVAEAQRQGKAEPRAVRELFRSLHTIKGLASMVGADPVVDIAHEMEAILRSADHAGGRLGDDALDLLVRGTRAIEERVHAISQQGVTGLARAPAQLLEALAAAQSAAQAPASEQAPVVLPDEVQQGLSAADREQILQAPQTGRRAVLVEFRPSPEHAAAGLNITSARARLSTLGDIVKVIPRAVPDAPTGIAFGVILVTGAGDESLAEAVGGSTDRVQQLHPRPLSTEAATSAQAEAESKAEWIPADHSIRVDVHRLDEALEQLSALVVTRLKLTRAASELSASGANTRALNAIIAENARQLRRLRAALTKARMVPLADLLQRLPLIVRGLTRDGDKAVAVALQTGSAEVDKAVADRIFPAVVHLVRNAVDHGIESREERLRAGKPETGRVSVICDDSSGTSLLLTVADDGRGIDRARVAAKLGAPVARSADELLAQITMPGLSTREDVTRTSGRGMGMDIVRRSVEALGGALFAATEEGSGTSFTLRVPVSITIVDVLSFLCGGQVFVAPVATVSEIVEVEAARVVTAPKDGALVREAARLIERRGEAVPFFSLAALLRGDGRCEGELPPKALIVQQGAGEIALGVDRMLGQHEAVVRPLDDVLVRVPGVTGATDLGDGMPTLVLDLAALDVAALARAGGGAMEAAP